MTLKTDHKDKITEILRQKIGKRILNVTETDRAELSLCTLSFQSCICPERHVWIDTDNGAIKIDLEDWQDENEWDNAVARIAVGSIDDGVDIITTWLSGASLDCYSNLNKEYGIIGKVVATHSTSLKS
ncbi:hypothetical protein [Lusitaniella coriacea]|uniref:hypothetical protein n=1 Tax=Lusitaniella coriacea TaxID=1983105 RepID=UPI003CEBCE07